MVSEIIYGTNDEYIIFLMTITEYSLPGFAVSGKISVLFAFLVLNLKYHHAGSHGTWLWQDRALE